LGLNPLCSSNSQQLPWKKIKEFKDLIDSYTIDQSNTILLPKYEPKFLVLGYQEDRN